MVPKMTKYSKFNDIHAVLNKANLLIVKIEEEYKKSLTSQTVSDELLVDIKDYLGNLRSALDYLRAKVSKHSFQICKTEKEFENVTTDLSDEIKNMIKKFQPFQGNDWISWFNTLNNKSKHLTLIPQKRKEDIRVTVSSPKGGSVSWGQDVTFGNGVSVMGVPIDPQTQMPIPNNIVKTEKITWVNFEFDNSNCPELPPNISALPFLKQCFEKISQIISEIEMVIK